jgi:hypothetical protein
MPSRDRAPVGAPRGADLWTSDVGGSPRFSAEPPGCDAQEPNATPYGTIATVTDPAGARCTLCTGPRP